MRRSRTATTAAGVVDLGSIEVRKSRHREVLETILGEIATGRFQPGDRLPTEAELSKRFSASRSTIARAMRDLKTRGLLNRQRGGGTTLARSEGKKVALLTPFAHAASELGHIGGLIHHHLSDLASQRTDHLRLQLIARTPTLGPERLESMMNAARTLIDQGVSGVFYYPLELPADVPNYNEIVVDRLLAAGVAVVAVDRDIVTFPQRSKLPLVTYDNRRAGYLVTNHLIERGAKRIAFIHTPLVSSAATDRLRGYYDAIEDAGLPLDRSLVFRPDFHAIDADFCRKLFEDVRPDAILCKQDHYAALVGRQLMSAGIKVGSDILLAGFDDEPFAELLPVPLTTIRFPPDPFAQVCYERLTAQMSNAAVPLPGMTLIDVELVVRASTGG